jgi:hypothetical protein
MRVMCAILFLSFTFIYLFYYQDDVLAVGQHVLSNGQTHYNRTIGAILITFVLFLLAACCFRNHKIDKAFTCLDLFSVIIDIDCHHRCQSRYRQAFLFWSLVVGIFLPVVTLYAESVWTACVRLQPYEPDTNSLGIFSRMMWINLMTMVIMFAFVGTFSCNNDLFHYRMHAEQCLKNNDFDGVLATGASSLDADSSLTMMRVYALSQKGELGERLFEYPIVGGSRILLPDSESVKLMIYPESKLYNYLGIYLKQKMSPINYLNFIEKHHVAKKAAADYLLCGYLLDKNLNAFVRNIGKYYKVNGNLPKHYREALTLYTHLRSNPVLIYHSNVMDADYQDYQDMEKKYPDKVLRQNYLHDTYGNTYWYYYQYAPLSK